MFDNLKINMINYKKELGKIGLGLLYTFLIGCIIYYAKLGILGVIGLLCLTSTCFWLYKSIKNGFSFDFKALFKGYGWIVLLVTFIGYLSKFGAFGYVLSIVLICAFIILKQRKKWLEMKHKVEAMLWGKPLYKFRKEGKKPPKIEIDWG